MQDAYRLGWYSLKQNHTAPSISSCKVLTSVVKGHRRDDISCSNTSRILGCLLQMYQKVLKVLNDHSASKAISVHSSSWHN